MSEPSLKQQNGICCPFSDCEAILSSPKTLRQHVRLYHNPFRTNRVYETAEQRHYQTQRHLQEQDRRRKRRRAHAEEELDEEIEISSNDYSSSSSSTLTEMNLHETGFLDDQSTSTYGDEGDSINNNNNHNNNDPLTAVMTSTPDSSMLMRNGENPQASVSRCIEKEASEEKQRNKRSLLSEFKTYQFYIDRICLSHLRQDPFSNDPKITVSLTLSILNHIDKTALEDLPNTHRAKNLRAYVSGFMSTRRSRFISEIARLVNQAKKNKIGISKVSWYSSSSTGKSPISLAWKKFDVSHRECTKQQHDFLVRLVAMLTVTGKRPKRAQNIIKAQLELHEDCIEELRKDTILQAQQSTFSVNDALTKATFEEACRSYRDRLVVKPPDQQLVTWAHNLARTMPATLISQLKKDTELTLMDLLLSTQARVPSKGLRSSAVMGTAPTMVAASSTAEFIATSTTRPQPLQESVPTPAARSSLTSSSFSAQTSSHKQVVPGSSTEVYSQLPVSLSQVPDYGDLGFTYESDDSSDSSSSSNEGYSDNHSDMSGSDDEDTS